MPRVAKSPRNGNTKANNLPPASISENTNHSSNGELEAEIRHRAYELFEQRGRTPGNENEDWLSAEREILARHHQPVA